MAWSADGTALAIGDENGSLQIVGTDGTERSLSSFAAGVNAVAFSPDGVSMAVEYGASLSDVKTDGRTILWTAGATAAEAIWSTEGHQVLISTPDGLAAVGSDGVPASLLIACPGRIGSFSKVGGLVAAVTDSGWLCSWRSAGD